MNIAETLNLGCLCRTLDPGLLRDQLESRPALRGLADDVASGRPNLFSATPVFISAHDHALLEGSVAALHRVSTLPGFRAAAMERAPAIAALDFGPAGVFMGYDFHLSEDGPRLIEINTNAGGAFLHAAAARAHRACCESKGEMFSTPFDLDTLDTNWIAMFHAEWRAQRGSTPLRSVAIVDDAPSQQYLAPEFQIYNIMSTLGSTVLAAGYILPVFYLLWSLKHGRKAGPNPWGATGLEWQTASPPPTTNFETVPIVTTEAYDYNAMDDETHDFVHEDEERMSHDEEDKGGKY